MKSINPPRMILKKLAISLIVLALIVLGIGLRLHIRRLNVQAEFAPIGQFVTVDGKQVQYKTTGAGRDLVLIHGASANLREWEFGMRAALEKSYRVTAFDRPAHGYSDPLASDNEHLSAQAAHLRTAAAALGIEDPILVGHSYGGSVAMAWALQEPPAALVLIAAPVLPWVDPLDAWYRITDTTAGAALGVPLAAALVPQSYVDRAVRGVFAPQTASDTYIATSGTALTLRRQTLAANTAQVNALLGDVQAQMPQYGALKTPVEMVYGAADTIVPLRVHGPLAQQISGAHLTVLAGVGHMPHHADLGAVLAAIDRAAKRAPLR